MKEYKYLVTEDAREDLRRHLSYIKRKFKNPQAIRNVRNDFAETVSSLATVAGAISEPESEELKKRGLKRINLKRHDYFLLYRINSETAEVMRMFHFLEDYENKLR